MIRTLQRSVSTRLGWTEGQQYTAVIGLILAAVLLMSGFPAALREAPEAFAAATPPAAPSIGDSPLPPLTAGPALPPGARPAIPPTASRSTATRPPAPTAPAPTDPVVGGPDTTEPEPGPTPCDAEPAVDATRDLLRTLDASIEAVPSDSTTALLATLAGCSAGEPAVALLALLAETGSGLPDPGVLIPVPALPFVEIPAPIIEALQPLRPALDPVCTQIGGSVALIVLAFGGWPGGIDDAYFAAISQALSVCGQIQVSS